MDANFWHQRWRDDEIGFHLQRVNPLLQRFWGALEVAPGASVLVPLCGKSLDLAWLRSRHHTVVGVELSALAIAAFFANQGLQPRRTPWRAGELWSAPGYRLYGGDYFALTGADVAAAAVYDRAALIALPGDQRLRYCQQLGNLVVPGAALLLITLEYDPAQMSGPPFSVTEPEVRTLFGDDSVQCLHAAEALEDNPGLRRRGLTSLVEKAYRVRLAS